MKVKIEMDRAAHKDVELAAELVRDVTDQTLPLVFHRDIADGSGDMAAPCAPLIEALVKLRLVKGARVHGRSQRQQLLHHRLPAHGRDDTKTKGLKHTCRLSFL